MPASRPLLGVLLAALLCLLHARLAAAGEQIADFIVAKVNDEIITSADVRKEILPALEALENNMVLDEKARRQRKIDLWTRAVRDKVEEVLALQSARKLGIQVEKREVDRHFDNLVEQVGSRQRVQEFATERGLTLTELRQTLRRQLTIRKLIEQKIGLGAHGGDDARRQTHDSYIRPAELRRYYNQSIDGETGEFVQAESVKLRMILLPWPDPTTARRGEDPKQTTRRLARSLMRLLEKGADFGTLSRIHSPKHLAQHDGEWRDYDESGKLLAWSWVDRQPFREPLQSAIFRLDRGQITPPIEMDGGIYIAQVVDKQEWRVIPFHEAQHLIRAKLHRERMRENLERVRADMRRRASIWPPDLFTARQSPSPQN